MCSDVSGACRTLETGAVFCHSHVDSRLGEVINGYRCVKGAGAGHTATFVHSQASEQTKQTYSHDIPQREISLDDRDNAYRQIIAELSLDPKHRERLKSDRGMSDDEIDKGMFRSVDRWQTLKGDYRGLPGVSRRNTLVAKDPGILIPIFICGKVAGLKVRLDQPGDDNRYQWVSSGGSVKLAGETPLPIYPGQGDSCYVAEGQGFKPFILRQRISSWVAGGGRYWHSCPIQSEKLIAQLHESGVNRIVLCPDAGDVLNIANIPELWLAEAEFFASQGFHVCVEWHNQIKKIDCDIDELEDYSNLETIDIEEFRDLIRDNNDINFRKWRRSRKFTPDIEMSDRYFQYPQIPDMDAMIAVKASLGKGKTQAQLLQQKRDGIPFVIVGYRNNLLSQTARRAAEMGLNVILIGKDDEPDNISECNKALCLDSLHKLEYQFKDKDIIIDEACSVLVHALNAGTLGDDQARAIRHLELAFRECNRVFLLDANLSDPVVNFYHSLCPDKKLIKIQNTANPSCQNIKIVEVCDEDGNIKIRDRSPLIKKLKGNERAWIYCDSKQKAKEIENILIKAGKRGYCLSSETSNEIEMREFLSDADGFVLRYNPDYMIMTPTAESGISCGDSHSRGVEKSALGNVTVNGHFTLKVSIFAGVSGTNSQLQALNRLRDEIIPHYIYCPVKSSVKNTSSPVTYSAKRFQEIIINRVLDSVDLLGQSDDHDRIMEVVAAALARSNDRWFSESCRLGTLDNYEKNNLRKCLMWALEESGNHVEIVNEESIADVKAEEKQAKEEVLMHDAEEIFKAKPYESEIDYEYDRKKDQNLRTQRRVTRHFYLSQLPDIGEFFDPDFIYNCLLKNKHFLSQCKLYWQLQNYEVAKRLFEKALSDRTTKEDFFICQLTRNNQFQTVTALRELGIMELLETEYHKLSESVVSIVSKLRGDKRLKSLLRMENLKTEDNPDENIKIIGRLLGMIGYQSRSVGQFFVGELKLRHYQSSPLHIKEVLKPGDYNFALARVKIIESVGKKYLEWFNSEKAIVSWDNQPLEDHPVIEDKPENMDTQPDAIAKVVVIGSDWFEGRFKVWGDISDKKSELMIAIMDDFHFVPADQVILAA